MHHAIMSAQLSSRNETYSDDLKTQLNTVPNNDTPNNQNVDEINSANGSNVLLLINHLGNTNDFLSKLKKLCENKEKCKKKCVLILIDCDDIGMLLFNKRITMIEAQNSINLLKRNICKIIAKSNDDSDNDNELFGYHLGSDLFALFVVDDNGNNKMTKSIEIAQYLLDVMQNKKESSFTISIGIGIGQIGDQREWVLRAHINLLRAKENGKNCYFNIQNNIDPTKNDKELIKLLKKAGNLYHDNYVDKCDSVLNDILDTFDQDTLLKQCITTKDKNSLHSVYHMKAKILFFRKLHFGNDKYRAYKANEWMKLCMKTFTLGRMSIECYYLYKTRVVEIENALFPKMKYVKQEIMKQAKERLGNHHNNHITKKYDLTLLTRKQKANPAVSKLNIIKGTLLYYGKQAFEHIGDISEAPLIGFAFAIYVAHAKMFNYQHELFEQVVKWDPTDSKTKHNLATSLWFCKHYYDECLDMLEKELQTTPDDTLLLSSAVKKYRDSCKLYIAKQMKHRGGKEILTNDEKLDKAIKYGQHMLNLVNNHGKWIRGSMYTEYGSLLYSWSKDFDKNKQKQVTALKMYEKLIKMDQQFGFDIINNWTRDLHKFERELMHTIVEYWYLPNNSMHAHILDCVDLIERYFNHDNEKMRRAKILSSIAPHGYFRKNIDKTRHGKECVCITIQKPSLYNKENSTGGNVSGLYNVVAKWNLDAGGELRNQNRKGEDEKQQLKSTTTRFSGSFAAKLSYFFTFWTDYTNFIINELGLTIDLIKEIRIVMIKLLMH